MSGYNVPDDDSIEEEISALLEEFTSETVTLFVTKCGIYGPSGSGKTNLRALTLNKARPKTRESTDIISEVDLVTPSWDEDMVDVQDGSVLKWFVVDDKKISRLLANTLFDKASTQPGEKIAADPSSVPVEQQQQQKNEYRVVKRIRKLLKEQLTAKKSNGGRKRKGGRKRRTLNKIKLVHLVDCGGQSQFQEVLPMFARNSSAHLLVHPLPHDLDDVPPFQYEVRGVKYDVQQKMQLTHRDIIYRSVRSICSSRYRKVVQSAIKIPKKPHIAVVGMFKDALTSPESQLLEKHRQVHECLNDLYAGVEKFEIMSPTRDRSKPVFAFDGSEKGWSTNAKELDKLRQFISDEERMISVELTIEWFLFLEIIKECTKTKEYLTLKRCEEIAQETIKMSPEDVKHALELFDELNLILHYPNILPGIVFTKPAFLYRKVTEIIVASFTNSKEVDTVQGERQKFHDSGIFSLELLEKTEFTMTGYSEDFERSDLLKLLKDLFIISPVGEGYFMPCVLPLEKPNSDLASELLKDVEVAGPLFVSFAEDCSPQGLFCATVTCLSEMPTFSVEGQKLIKRRNLIEFQIQEQVEDDASGTSLDQAGSMILWDKMTHFEIFCTGCDKANLPQVRKAVKTAISKASQVMHYNIEQLGLKLGFRCTSNCGVPKCHGNSISWRYGHWSARCLKNQRHHSRPLDLNESFWYPSYGNTSIEGNLLYQLCKLTCLSKMYYRNVISISCKLCDMFCWNV